MSIELNNKKVKRLEALLASFDEGAVQPEELIEAIDAVMVIINQTQDATIAQLTEDRSLNAKDIERVKNALDTANNKLNSLISEVKNDSVKEMSTIRNMIVAEVARVESSIPELPDEFDATDLQLQISSQKEMLDSLSTLIVAENIRNGLESLPEGEKLEIDAIEGLKKKLEELGENTSTGKTTALIVHRLDQIADVTNAGTATTGQVLTKQSDGTYAFEDATGGDSLPDQSGNTGKFLTTDGTDASWGTPTVSGDLVGPSSAANNSVPTYDGTTGKLVQDQGSMFIDDDGNVGIGTLSPSAKLHISEGNLELDNTTNANQFGTITKGGNRFIHDFNYGDNGSVTTSGFNTFIGDGVGNFTMGSGATGAHEASYNTIIGNGAFTSNTRGYSNIALGYVALAGNTTGDGNFALGNNSLQLITNGRENIAIGRFAGTYIANGSSANTTGDFSIFLGTNAKALANNNQNQIVIGYNATGIGSNSVVLGNDSIVTTALKGNVGIATTTPTAKLHVDQSSTTAEIPVLTLDQADISEEMISFETTIGTGNAIEAVGAKTLTTTHFIKVTLPGGLTRYIPAGTIA